MLRYSGKPDYCHIVIESIIIIMLALVIQFSIGAQLPLKVFLLSLMSCAKYSKYVPEQFCLKLYFLLPGGFFASRELVCLLSL